MHEKILAIITNVIILPIFTFTNVQLTKRGAKKSRGKLGNFASTWPCLTWRAEVVIIKPVAPQIYLSSDSGEVPWAWRSALKYSGNHQETAFLSVVGNSSYRGMRHTEVQKPQGPLTGHINPKWNKGPLLPPSSSAAVINHRKNKVPACPMQTPQYKCVDSSGRHFLEDWWPFVPCVPQTLKEAYKNISLPGSHYWPMPLLWGSNWTV